MFLKFPYMPFYIGDYLTKTQDLSLEEHGAYCLLIMHYWTNGPFEFSTVKIARILRISLRKSEKLMQTLIRYFDIDQQGLLRHDRIDKEIEKIKKKYHQTAEAGRLGGIANAKANAKANATISLPVSLEQSESELIKDNNKPPISPLQGDYADILEFLNQQTGARFEFIPTNLNLISARLKEGRTVEQLKNMIQFKVSEWKGTDMAKYLRPETLFNKTKCASYCGEMSVPKPKEKLPL